MTRYQKASLLIGALILIAVVALVAVFALKAPTPMVTVIATATPNLSAGEKTGTWAAEVMAMNPASLEAFSTAYKQTATHP